MIHGLSVPVLPGFELRTDHYDWALWLAQAGGFDVFMLDFQGSGRSPRPKMDDPCNVPKAQQQSILIPNPLSATCVPSYPFQLINSQSDWSELDTVVDYIRDIRGVDKVALVSWSQGSFRIGPYAVQHPGKVESLLLYAPIYNPAGRAGTGPDGFAPPGALPQPGTPLTLTTRSGLMVNRWGPEIQCEGQVEEGIQDAVWSAIMANDELGSSWGPPPAGVPAGSPPEGVMRVRSPFVWGWNSSTASRIEVPALIIYGEFDNNVLIPPQTSNPAPILYETIPQANKLLFKVQCAGHFMVWEKQRRVLHHISKEWLEHGAVEGFTNGSFFVDTEGNLVAQ
jgi:pimeloyl-ACP methyl ester carboxylesterase